LVERAGRSVVDRFLGMEEAAGSIPAQSISFFVVSQPHVFILAQRGSIQINHACPRPDPS
jgi:hypothetical protein